MRPWSTSPSRRSARTWTRGRRLSGRQRLLFDARRADPARWVARRPLWSAANVSSSIGVVWFRDRLAVVRPRADVRDAGRGPRPPGRRRGPAHAGQLAIISGELPPTDRARADRRLVGLGGVATAIGPFLGGYLDRRTVSWRWIFLINLPIAAPSWSSPDRHVPESVDPSRPGNSTSSGRPRARSVSADHLLLWRASELDGLFGPGSSGRSCWVGRRRGVRSRRTAQRPSDAPSGHLPDRPVHRCQRGHVRRVRRTRRGLLPAQPLAPGGPGSRRCLRAHRCSR